MDNTNDLMKRCSRCKTFSSKPNFFKKINMSDGLHPHCISCRKPYYNEDREKTRKYFSENRNKIKKYYLENRDKIKTRLNDYFKNRIKPDVNFRLTCSTKRRFHHALNGKLISSSTKEILETDIDTYRKCIEWQMTQEMSWPNIEIDHVKPVCMFDVTKDKELKFAFN